MDYFLRFLAFAALTCSFKPLPALNAGDLEAAIVIVLPFCGLRPSRAARSRTSNVPKPITCTLPPAANSSATVSNTAFTAFSASFLVNSVFYATLAINSVLFMTEPP